MHTPTLAPPGWYEDVSRPGRPRFWDGYQFPDEQVTICPAGHQTPMSAIFCPHCGQVPGPTRLTTLTGQDRSPGAETSVTTAGAGQPGISGSATLGHSPEGTAMPGRPKRWWTATVGRIADALTRTARQDVASARRARYEPPVGGAARDAGQGARDINDRHGAATQVPAQRERPDRTERQRPQNPGHDDARNDTEGTTYQAAGQPCGHIRHARFAGARHGLTAEGDCDQSWHPCPGASSDPPDDSRR